MRESVKVERSQDRTGKLKDLKTRQDRMRGQLKKDERALQISGQDRPGQDRTG